MKTIDEQFLEEEIVTQIQTDVSTFLEDLKKYQENIERIKDSSSEFKEKLSTNNLIQLVQQLIQLSETLPIKELIHFGKQNTLASSNFQNSLEGKEKNENTKFFIETIENLSKNVSNSFPQEFFQLIFFFKNSFFESTETFQEAVDEITENLGNSKGEIDQCSEVINTLNLFSIYYDHLEHEEDEFSLDEIFTIGFSIEEFKKFEKEKLKELLMKDSSRLSSLSRIVSSKNEVLSLLSKINFNAITKIFISFQRLIEGIPNLSNFIKSLEEFHLFILEPEKFSEEKAAEVSEIFEKFIINSPNLNEIYTKLDVKMIKETVEKIISLFNDSNFTLEYFQNLRKKKSLLLSLIEKNISIYNEYSVKLSKSVERSEDLFENEETNEQFEKIKSEEPDVDEVDVSEISRKIKKIGSNLFIQDEKKTLKKEDLDKFSQEEIQFSFVNELDIEKFPTNIGSEIFELLEDSDIFDEIQNEIATIRINFQLYFDSIPELQERLDFLKKNFAKEKMIKLFKTTLEITEKVPIIELLSFQERFQNQVEKFEKNFKSGDQFKEANIDLSTIEMETSEIFINHISKLITKIIDLFPFEFFKFSFMLKKKLEENIIETYLNVIENSCDFIKETEQILEKSQNVLSFIDLFTAYYDQLNKNEKELNFIEILDIASQIDFFNEECSTREDLVNKLTEESSELRNIRNSLESKGEIMKTIQEFDLNAITKVLLSIKGITSNFNAERFQKTVDAISEANSFFAFPKETLDSILGEEKSSILINFVNEFKVLFDLCQFSNISDQLLILISFSTSFENESFINALRSEKFKFNELMKNFFNIYHKIMSKVVKSIDRSEKYFTGDFLNIRSSDASSAEVILQGLNILLKKQDFMSNFESQELEIAFSKTTLSLEEFDVNGDLDLTVSKPIEKEVEKKEVIQEMVENSKRERSETIIQVEGIESQIIENTEIHSTNIEIIPPTDEKNVEIQVSGREFEHSSKQDEVKKATSLFAERLADSKRGDSILNDRVHKDDDVSSTILSEPTELQVVVTKTPRKEKEIVEKTTTVIDSKLETNKLVSSDKAAESKIKENEVDITISNPEHEENKEQINESTKSTDKDEEDEDEFHQVELIPNDEEQRDFFSGIKRIASGLFGGKGKRRGLFNSSNEEEFDDDSQIDDIKQE
eukprot:gene6786-10950_t